MSADTTNSLPGGASPTRHQVTWTPALVRKHAAQLRRIVMATAGNGRVSLDLQTQKIDITEPLQALLDKAMADVGVVEFYRALETS